MRATNKFDVRYCDSEGFWLLEEWKKDNYTIKNNRNFLFEMVKNFYVENHPDKNTFTKKIFILELGTGEGESLEAFVRALKNINNGGKVVTIDIDKDRQDRIKKQLEEFNSSIVYINGDCRSRETFLKAMETSNEFDILFVDCDHYGDHPHQELEKYHELVKEDGFIIFHDHMWYEAVSNAITNFLLNHKNYAVVIRREFDNGMVVLWKFKKD